MGVLVCIGNQKGGVGKSTITNLMAHYIHKNTDYSVMVVDGDYLQESLTGMRNYELKKFIEELTLAAEAEGISVTPSLVAQWQEKFIDECYPLVTKDTNTITTSVTEYKEDYDFVFVDLPGNLQAEGVVGVYLTMDFLFIPTDLTFKDMDSTRRFLEMCNSRIVPVRKSLKAPIKLYGILNKVKEQTIEFRNKEENLKEHNLNIPFLKNYLTETLRLKRDDSTISTANMKGLSNSNMVDDLCKEIIETILKDINE